MQELRRHVKREFAKLLTLLQAYAVIATGVRIICTNQVPRWASSSQSPELAGL
jgi:DNA mismatch repair protein PMS2